MFYDNVPQITLSCRADHDPEPSAIKQGSQYVSLGMHDTQSPSQLFILGLCEPPTLT